MQFPTVTGSNLQRKKLTLPQDFEGELNLVLHRFPAVAADPGRYLDPIRQAA